MNSFSRIAGSIFATAAFAFAQPVHPIANMFKPQATPADSVYSVSMLMLAICAAIQGLRRRDSARSNAIGSSSALYQRSPSVSYTSLLIVASWSSF